MIVAGTEKCGVNEPDSIRRVGMSVGANACENCPTCVTCLLHTDYAQFVFYSRFYVILGKLLNLAQFRFHYLFNKKNNSS